MTDTWVGVPDRRPTSPQGARAGLTLLGAWVSGLCYCSQNQTDGLLALDCIPMAMPMQTAMDSKGRAYTPETLARDLVAAGLAEIRGDNLYFPDFLQHNRSAAERAALSENRRRAGRSGGQASGVTRAEASASAKSKPPVCGGGGVDLSTTHTLSADGSTSTSTSNCATNSEALASYVLRAKGILSEIGFNGVDGVFLEHGDVVVLAAMVAFSHKVIPAEIKNVPGLFRKELSSRPQVVALPSESELEEMFERFWNDELVDYVRSIGSVAVR